MALHRKHQVELAEKHHRFLERKTKVQVPTQERVMTKKGTMPLYAEGVHILDGLADEEVRPIFRRELEVGGVVRN